MAHQKLTTKENLLPFILITALFFLWGMAHGMLDVLNKHFQTILEISKAKSGMIQFSVYTAYFLMAIPAGNFMRRFGYRKGIILGLVLFASGALLIAATTRFESFWLFLIFLFMLGCGLATLETAANPYTTRLGPPETGERRINFSQSFNGMAWTVGPLIGIYIYNSSASSSGEKLSSLTLPYLLIGLVVFLVAIVFLVTKLPEIEEDEVEGISSSEEKPLIKERHLVLGVIAQFCYVAAQTGIFSYLINFVTDVNQKIHFDVNNGPYFLSIGFALFMIGRMLGSYLMKFLKPSKLLAIYALMCCLLLPVVTANIGWGSIIALYCIFFFMSIMFPTIFAMAIKDLGPRTKKASSYLIMSIVGGAVFPMLMGLIADVTNSIAVGFLAPIPLFIFILYYAVSGHKVKTA
ncbi:MAG TPA: sugar MFS transporter [Prolixibacteraceae bacterium]|nr:sugar MFS transporter [Prolixibacteraceae bacterium]